MIHGSNTKTLNLVLPVAGSAGATYAVTMDTAGYDYLVVTALLGSSGTSATDNPSVLKLGEGSVSNVSSHTNISGFVGDTDFTIPVSTAASSGMIIKMGVNLKARQRYISYAATLGAATNNAVVAELSRAEISPTTATLQGVNTLVVG